MKYKHKLTFDRSRFLFVLKVIARWFRVKPGLIYSPGVHLITGASGSGKTLLMNIIIHSILKKDGFVWANMDEFAHQRVLTFDIDKLFQDGEQKYRLPKRAYFIKPYDSYTYCKAVVIDELNARFNRRMNRQTDYNDVFVPMIKFTVTHRHQIADRLYFIGQSLLLQDGQIQAILKVRHDVKASKRWRYYFFREQKKMLYLPKKLIITNHVNSGVDPNGNIIWIQQKIVTKIKVIPSDFETYDTHAFEKLFDHLPEYKG